MHSAQGWYSIPHLARCGAFLASAEGGWSTYPIRHTHSLTCHGGGGLPPPCPRIVCLVVKHLMFWRRQGSITDPQSHCKQPEKASQKCSPAPRKEMASRGQFYNHCLFTVVMSELGETIESWAKIFFFLPELDARDLVNGTLKMGTNWLRAKREMVLCAQYWVRCLGYWKRVARGKGKRLIRIKTICQVKIFYNSFLSLAYWWLLLFIPSF